MAKKARGKRDPDKLSSLELLFVLKLLELNNATEAYIRAGHPTCGRPAAGVQASRLLKIPRVKASYEAALAARVQQAELDVDAALAVVNDTVRFDPLSIRDAKGAILPMEKWPKAARNVLESMDESAYGTRVRFLNKARAAERILEAHGRLKAPSVAVSDLAKLLADGASDEDRKHE